MTQKCEMVKINCCSVTNKIRSWLWLWTMTHRLLHLASSESKGQQTANKQPSSDARSRRSLKHTLQDSMSAPPQVNFCRTHLFLQLGELARQVGHQFHGRLQFLLQASDLVLLPVCVAADQRHGPHPWEPVQVVLLKAQSLMQHGLAFKPLLLHDLQRSVCFIRRFLHPWLC